MGLLKSISRRKNAKHVKRLRIRALEIDALKEQMAALSDEELKAKTKQFQEILQGIEDREAQNAKLDEILNEVFAVCREAAKRVLNQFPYLVQVMGALVLHDGDIAEMKTGEGKTLTATMAVYANALTGRGVHVITVNEYLAKRDAEWMGAIYRFLGLTVGCNIRELTPEQKREAYLSDITYTTNSELGFDYLRDNMARSLETKVQLKGLNYCVIDECDSILIDECRTPLIISGGNKANAALYVPANRFARSLIKGTHFDIDITTKQVFLTEAGTAKAEQVFGIKNLFDMENAVLVHCINNALKANYAMARDFDYVVKDDEIVIVDQNTGRFLKGRAYSDGLHQAIQAKERVTIKAETVTLATITYQNFFRLYNKVAGMTGTAKTEEEEFMDTYNMRVVAIPTNRPIQRIDAEDKVYQNKEYKFKALVQEVKERHEKGQPVLVGTVAVETSEYISELFRRAGIPHEVLNAKNHEREAHIIEKAGQKGAVTIATNMAGRGTDIKLGEGVKELGGLAVIGSERHESRRIDGQLRGRSGRQGDPGYSRFYVSLEDELMLRFGNDTMKKLFSTLGEDAIENKMITNAITSAQERVEGSNYDSRKSLLDYDDVLRKQREMMYGERDKIIEREDVHEVVEEFFTRVAKKKIMDACVYIDQDPVLQLDELKKTLVPAFYTEEGFIEITKQFRNLETEDIIPVLAKSLLAMEEERKAEWGEGIFRSVEKQVLLRVVDQNWTKHIDRMDKLRNGIGLRSYAHTNPLQDYIHEGFEMFQNMMDTIAEQTASFLLHAQVKMRQPEPQKEENAENKEEKPQE